MKTLLVSWRSWHCFWVCGSVLGWGGAAGFGAVGGGMDVAVVFVSRQIPMAGTVYWDTPRGMPGVGPYSRFQVAAPGRLMSRASNGELRILVDGAQPTAASLNLVDVNSPSLSEDGGSVLFAGLPAGNYSKAPMENPGAWRIFVINMDGKGLRALTRSDLRGDFSGLGALAAQFRLYDDTDPAWLPDGRLVFSSTRYPSFAMYGAARTSNLFMVNPDGTDLHRITTERNGADRPAVDPLTGRVVYSRWWRNFREPTDSLSTVPAPGGGYRQHLGLIAANVGDDPTLGGVSGGSSNLKRNAWQLAAVNPDGTDLAQWAGVSGLFLVGEDSNHAYGGCFAPDGSFFANFFPMKNLTEAAGFGGIRHYQRGANLPVSILGVTSELGYSLASQNPPSYGVFRHDYACDPAVLPDGRLVVSWAPDYRQDYGLYVVNADGSDRQLVWDRIGTTELRTCVVVARPKAPIVADRSLDRAQPAPPLEAGRHDRDGRFSFMALNVYFNAPVDSDIVSAIPVGSAGTIRFFLDHQRRQPGSFEAIDWPVLLDEIPVTPGGFALHTNLPANVPLFEQIRTPAPEYRVPLTGRTERGNRPGAAHVGGLNFSRPGEVVRCVGCHAGHTMIPVPADPQDALWSNLAPGALISFSSTHPNPYADSRGLGLIDRKVMKGETIDYWRSDPRQEAEGQWVQLTFPVPVAVRQVRLYGARHEAEVSVGVGETVVELLGDVAGVSVIERRSTGPVEVGGTLVRFQDVLTRSVRIWMRRITGRFEGERVASLAEVEVIAQAVAVEPKITATRRSAAEWVVKWPTTAGWRYDLESADTPYLPRWREVASIRGTGRVVEFLHSYPVTLPRYFRVIISKE